MTKANRRSKRAEKLGRLIDDGAHVSDLGFYLIVLPGLLLPVAYFRFIAWKEGPALRTIRDRWGQPRPASGEFTAIARYHQARSAGGLDEQTWDDLDLAALFRQLDHTSSAVGQQVLYDILRHPQPSVEALRERDRLAQCFAADADLREAVQRALDGLDSKNAFDLPRLFLQTPPEFSRAWLAVPAGTALALLALTALPYAGGLGVLALLVLLAANIALGLIGRRRWGDIGVALKSLHQLLVTGERIGAIGRPELAAQTAHLRCHTRRLRRLKKLSAYLAFDNHFNEVLTSAYAYLNTFLLLDLNVLLACANSLRKKGPHIRAVYESIGQLDAALAIASYRHSLPFYCTPRFVSAADTFSVRDAYHPLLSDPVANSLHLDRGNLLIYGANMSGKTTFLRSLGLCALLGQTIYTCPAQAYRAPVLQVRSFINRKDDILGGQSYFLAEVKTVKTLLRAAAQAQPHLFLIDELFKGTSPRECTALSQAVLAYLAASGHRVAVASHDVSLQSLLPDWTLFHFDSSAATGRFDYKLRRGPGAAQNALHLLVAQDYPPAVIRAAEKNLAALRQINPPPSRENR